MAKGKDRPEHRLYDERIVHRFIHDGVVAEKDYDKFVKSLPDQKENADVVAVSMEPADDADDDETTDE